MVRPFFCLISALFLSSILCNGVQHHAGSNLTETDVRRRERECQITSNQLLPTILFRSVLPLLHRHLPQQSLHTCLCFNPYRCHLFILSSLILSLPGTCYTSSECSSAGGSADGNCAAGFGVCCKCQYQRVSDSQEGLDFEVLGHQLNIRYYIKQHMQHNGQHQHQLCAESWVTPTSVYRSF